MSMAPVPSDSKPPTNEVPETQRSPDENQNDAAGAREEDNERERRQEGGGEEEGHRDEEEEEEEQMECGFCLFMKGGGCKESFISWEKCIEEAEKSKEDVVEKCAEVTRVLRECMLRHSDYYEPLLSAEKAMEDQAARELEQEEAAAASEDPNSSQKMEGDKKVDA
ncbi:uncharacterized protein LOC116249705 [Nymphaea colorata]|uniref:GCK domain-containing protein n=1 Tax=Nymphaea colorata TaxID=210225 RepID=A0A5K1B2F4_9MAGN|nr:uncharacterized protein LOC116249705 [Nymphaea colorata]